MTEFLRIPEQQPDGKTITDLLIEHELLYEAFEAIEDDLANWAANAYVEHDQCSPEQLESAFDPFAEVYEFYKHYSKHNELWFFGESSDYKYRNTYYEFLSQQGVTKVVFADKSNEKSASENIYIADLNQIDDECEAPNREEDYWVIFYTGQDEHSEAGQGQQMVFEAKRRLTKVELEAIKSDLRTTNRRIEDIIDAYNNVEQALHDFKI